MESKMKEVTREQSRQIMLSMLKDITEFCDKYNITYFLSAGTLIGAIRHKGFIPWDDDIDIEIPRPDYNRFIDLYSKLGKYEICTPQENNSIYVYAKVYDATTIKFEGGVDYSRFTPLGIDIDIFPIDGQPEDICKFKKEVSIRRRIFSYFHSCICPTENKKITSLAKILVCRIFGKNFFSSLFVKSASRYNYETSKKAGFVAPYTGYDLKHRHRKEVYEDKVKVPFEDGEYWVPKGYDEYLRDVYGDYMKLPPTEQQQTHHTNNIFWKE